MIVAVNHGQLHVADWLVKNCGASQDVTGFFGNDPVTVIMSLLLMFAWLAGIVVTVGCHGGVSYAVVPAGGPVVSVCLAA